jgi:hypothetical protein
MLGNSGKRCYSSVSTVTASELYAQRLYMFLKSVLDVSSYLVTVLQETILQDVPSPLLFTYIFSIYLILSAALGPGVY